MDATDEFRFINTAATSTSSSTRIRRSSSNSSHPEEGASSTSSSTNSLRTVPVCVYNENRSFKLRFFWDKAFKLFHSHRPVYRAVSGINYQDCGTIGSTSSTVAESSPGPTGLAKLRSQSHNQLNRIVPLNEMDLFRSQSRRHKGAGYNSERIVATISSPNSNQTEHCHPNGVAIVAGPSESVSSPQDFIPVVVPRRKNRVFGGGNKYSGTISGCGSSSSLPVSTNISPLTKTLQESKHSSVAASKTDAACGDSSISGGEKPHHHDHEENDNNKHNHGKICDGEEDEDSSYFFYYDNNCTGDYDNITSMHVNSNYSKNRGKCSSSSTANAIPTGAGVSTSSIPANHIVFPYSTIRVSKGSHVIVPSRQKNNSNHHSAVSATLSLRSSLSKEAGAPVHLRRTQSSKSHHHYHQPGNESQQRNYYNNSNSNPGSLNGARISTDLRSQENKSLERSGREISQDFVQREAPSPTCSAYESWKSWNGKDSIRVKSQGHSSSSKCQEGCGCGISGSSHRPCWSDKSVFSSDLVGGGDCGSCNRGNCTYSNCEGSCHEDESDAIGNDSGLDTWKRKRAIGDDLEHGGVKVKGGSEPGIVCTISQRIPGVKATPVGRSADEIDSDEENDYVEIHSEGEDVEDEIVLVDRAIVFDSIEAGSFLPGDEMRTMIENGNVMYDSLEDDTYSVVHTRATDTVSSSGSGSNNGNTTVVLINGCCNTTSSDHCQNTALNNGNASNQNSLSDTFNFSDYDVECMSEIDLNSEPGSSCTDPGSTIAGSNLNEDTKENILTENMVAGGSSSPMKYAISNTMSENELDSLDLAMFERQQKEAASSTSFPVGTINGSENGMTILRETAALFLVKKSDTSDDIKSSLCGEVGSSSANNTSTTTITKEIQENPLAKQILLLGQKYYGVSNHGSTCSSTKSAPSIVITSSSDVNDKGSEEMYSNWSDAGSEFEFVGPSALAANDRDIPMGHSPRGNPPDVEWEPYFCVLNQLDQTFTSYRSEEMSIFPGTPTRPRTQTNVFGENGISPTEIPRVRLDGGPNSIKCLINNAKWGMNTLMEEEEEANNTNISSGGGAPSSNHHHNVGDYSSSSGSSGGGSSQRTTSNPTSPLDTSYDKACGSERRGSAPLTPLLGRETPSRFANFFSKRSFKSNPLKRTKSVTKLERKKAGGIIEPESGNALYPSRMRISRSHESLLAWTNNPVNSFMSNGMMSTMDLTAGDVSIRPLHPSILGQEYAFQVTTPTGSKYYTCSSAAERDSWVYAFRQAIRPRADEVRRRENALKIWILEGKGIPSSGKHSNKRYFCELYLDDVLYARTCGKPRGEMLFWGEHFEFTQLPNCVQLITVVFFREGDKKRKKERNTCIGKVKIPVNTVTSRYLIEKWYPVLPDSTSSSSSHSSKEKEYPSLRVKCKYQSVDILPLRCYKSFLQYIKDQYGPLSECLESVLSVKAKEDLASAMVHVLHHEGLAKEFIAELALQEILKSGDEKLTFRGNSIATKAMEAFLKLTGTEYLHATLGPFIEQFQGSEDLYDCEIDPMKLPMNGSGAANLSKNQQNLRMAVDTVWKAIMHSHTIFPMELRECFSHCREALKSAGKEELSDHLISASIFLRFLCPAILSPSLFNITNEYPSEKSARNLTLIAKVLQTLANFTRFQGKENYMEFINDFVEREASNMKAFLSCISSPLNPEAVKKAQKESRDKVPAGGFIDLGKYLSVLSTLLSENVAKIAPKNDRFKHLQELLETIHKWLEQPANATNVSMFPFPHLPSPPPSGPPPPAPLGIPMNHRFNNPLCNSNIANASSNLNGNSQNGNHLPPQNPINHQYHVPHHVVNGTATPIYAVTNVIHNNSNPNVKNISQVQMNLNGGSCGGIGIGMTPPYPLQLQIPHSNSNPVGIVSNNQRSGSQASSGYQSQSPVLEGDDKSGKKPAMPSSHIKEQINAHINNINMRATEMQDATTALTFNNPVFNRKVGGSQSVDDLSTVGTENKADELVYPRRLARSSSSSDCECAHSNVSPTKVNRSRGQGNHKLYSNGSGNLICGGQQTGKSQTKSIGHNHHRLSRRSSAELLKKNHPYSSSSDEDSDSGLVNERDEPPITPHLPPRRSHINKSRGNAAVHRPVPDGSCNGEKSLEEYEREMLELRRAMEALQVKLSRAEERLFGNESPGQQNKRPRDNENANGGAVGSPTNSIGSGNGAIDRYSRSSDDGGCKEMDQLLQRLLSAEEEMKREHDLLTALDKKQKLIEAQEQKISRLDAVNNQLLQALAQIRDSLQQQHVQQQQQKIQQQLIKQQQHLRNLANGFAIPSPPSTLSVSTSVSCNSNHHPSVSHRQQQSNMNNNGSLDSRSTQSGQMHFSSSGSTTPSVIHRDPMMSNNCNPNLMNINNQNSNNNTTKVLITSSSNESLSQATTSSLTGDISYSNNSCSSDSALGNSNASSNRDSSAILGEQALKMLAELRSSSC